VLAALAQAQHRAGKSDAAVRTLKKAVRLAPENAPLHADLGVVLTDMRALDAAVAAFRKAAASAPSDPEILADLARTLSETEALDEALETARRACALAPENAEVLNSLGVACYRLGEIEAARDAFARAVAAAPGHAHARKNLGMMALLCGDFEAGWPDYAARHTADGTQRITGVPEWRGEGLYGQRLLVTAEQGLGDTIQFVRFLPRLTAMGAHVTFAAPAALADLVAAMPGAGTVVAAGARARCGSAGCPDGYPGLAEDPAGDHPRRGTLSGGARHAGPAPAPGRQPQRGHRLARQPPSPR